MFRLPHKQLRGSSRGSSEATEPAWAIVDPILGRSMNETAPTSTAPGRNRIRVPGRGRLSRSSASTPSPVTSATTGLGVAAGDSDTAPNPDPAPTDQATDREHANQEVTRNNRDRLAEQWERRLSVPVTVAALLSIPALFLAVFADGPLRLVGQILTWASLGVLTGETMLLLILSGHRWSWLRRHWWAVLVLVLAIPAVVLALAPAQALRLLQVLWQLGRLQILRVRTIARAGRVLARRIGLTRGWRYVVGVGGSLLAVGFVALVLIDPTASAQRERVLSELLAWSPPAPVLVLIAVLVLAGAVAGWAWLRWRHGRSH
jgi:hypothetical protein